jgi:hypothetical protein
MHLHAWALDSNRVGGNHRTPACSPPVQLRSLPPVLHVLNEQGAAVEGPVMKATPGSVMQDDCAAAVADLVVR